MKKIFNNLKKCFYFISFLPLFIYGANGNVLKNLENNINTQVTEAGSSLASVLNTIILVFGVLWIIFLLLVGFFNMEAIKNHMKSVVIASIILGVTYGLTAAAI